MSLVDGPAWEKENPPQPREETKTDLFVERYELEDWLKSRGWVEANRDFWVKSIGYNVRKECSSLGMAIDCQLREQEDGYSL